MLHIQCSSRAQQDERGNLGKVVEGLLGPYRNTCKLDSSNCIPCAAQTPLQSTYDPSTAWPRIHCQPSPYSMLNSHSLHYNALRSQALRIQDQTTSSTIGSSVNDTHGRALSTSYSQLHPATKHPHKLQQKLQKHRKLPCA